MFDIAVGFWWWFQSLPWPSAAHLFTSSVVTIFSLTVFAIPKIWIGEVANQLAPPDRVKRTLINKMHVRNDHKTKLKYCQAGFCKDRGTDNPVTTGHHVVASTASEFSI